MIILSPFWLCLLLPVCCCILISGLRAVHHLAGQSLPELGADAAGTSPLHRWDPRCKLAALLGFALFAVSLASPWSVLAALLCAVGLQTLSGLPWQRPLHRLRAISGFLLMLIIVLPLTAANRPEDSLLIFEGLPGLAANLRGLELALVITGKAWTVALLAEPMLATAPPAATMAGLHRLGLPPTVTSLLLITHRYLFVFREEAFRLRLGMQARGFRPRPSWTGLRELGNFLGMLLVRSYERTQRVQQAMLARGYRCTLPEPPSAPTLPTDRLATGLVLMFGLLLLLADRWVMG